MTYEPDEQDELVGDAMAVGGPRLVEELHRTATRAAEAACPWDGLGAEPAAYRQAWIAAAREVIAGRRARLAGPDQVGPGESDPGPAVPDGTGSGGAGPGGAGPGDTGPEDTRPDGGVAG